jgi:hypothetical protein
MQATCRTTRTTFFYQYRGKGGKRGRWELPQPAYGAIVRALSAFGMELAMMNPGSSLWPGVGTDSITTGTAYLRFRQYLRRAGFPPSGPHVLRYTAGEAASRRGRIGGIGLRLPGSLQPGSHLDLSASARGGEADEAWRSLARALAI